MKAQEQILTIDIVADVVCPWCYVGYQRLLAALAKIPEHSFEIQWHPFELNPDMPDEGQSVDEYLLSKYRSTAEESAANLRHLEELGKAVGVKIDYSKIKTIVNSFRAHQLLHWAKNFDRQSQLQSALFEAYFASGGDLNDPAVLANLADSVGLDPDEAAGILQDGRYQEAVREEETLWIGQGVRSVPTFLIGDHYALSGAREAEELEPLIREALNSRP